jgi:hypothetical protein
MWTDSNEARELIAEVSRNIVAGVAAEELELFDELAQDFFEHPQPTGSSTSADDPLGFGLETLAAVTPAALAMVQVVVVYLASEVIKAARDETAKAVTSRVRSHLSGKKPVSLSVEQLKHVRELSRQQALKFGMSKEAAESMSQALVGSLVIAD